MHITLHHTGPLHISTDVCTPPLGSFVDARVATALATAPPTIGQYWEEQGGVYAGLVHDDAGDYHLLVAERFFGRTHLLTTFCTREAIAGLQLSERDGKGNTTQLANLDAPYPAADFAASCDYGGHMDWYLPTRWELMLCRVNLPAYFGEGGYWSSTVHELGMVQVTSFERQGEWLSPPEKEHLVAPVRQVRI